MQYGLKGKLLPHQEEQASRMVKKRACILVEKTGKGKSFTTLASFLHLKNNGKLDTMVVLTPRNAYQRLVWESEVSKWSTAKAIDIEALYKRAGNSPERIKLYLDKYPIVYGKHTHVNSLPDVLRLITQVSKTLVVIDELHKFKNPKSTMSINARLCLKDRYAIWGLTATPLSKDMMDVFNLVNFVRPWYLGTFEQFKSDYCKVQEKIIGRLPGGRLKKVEEIVGVSNYDALQIKLRPLVIQGSSLFEVKFHFRDYEMTQNEKSIYKRLASGMFSSKFEEESAEDWFKRAMKEEFEDTKVVGDVKRHSSRFLYMQFAADGIISNDGSIGSVSGSKVQMFKNDIREIINKGLSAIVYFEYYATLNVIKRELEQEYGNKIVILQTTGEKNIKPDEISEEKVKLKPHVILSTKAGSESASMYYINNVMLFHIPTAPEPFIQIVGRITRVNTLFPDDLNCYIYQNENIDKYKLCMVSSRAEQMKIVSGEELNIPSRYKDTYSNVDEVRLLKKYLLWQSQ